MHAGCIEIAEPGIALLRFAIHEVKRGRQEFFINRFHAFFGKRSGIFNYLLAYLAKLGIKGCIILFGCLAFQHAPGPEFFAEVGVLWIIGIFWFFLRVEVVEVSEELIKS